MNGLPNLDGIVIICNWSKHSNIFPYGNSICIQASYFPRRPWVWAWIMNTICFICLSVSLSFIQNLFGPPDYCNMLYCIVCLLLYNKACKYIELYGGHYHYDLRSQGKVHSPKSTVSKDILIIETLPIEHFLKFK